MPLTVTIDQEQRTLSESKPQETREIVSKNPMKNATKKHDPYYNSMDGLNFQMILLFP